MHIVVEHLLGDQEAQVFWIDPMRSFSILRMVQLLNARGITSGPELDAIIERIFVGREDNLDAIEAFLDEFPEASMTRLIVLGNVAMPFHGTYYDSIGDRVNRIQRFGLALRRNAYRCGWTILVINQMTTRFKPDAAHPDGKQSYVVPAFGDVWSVYPDVRIHLEHDPRDRDRRSMHIVKSLTARGKKIPFRITVSSVIKILTFLGLWHNHHLRIM